MNQTKIKDKDIALWKKLLDAVETQSTCKRLQVGCIIIKDGRMISSGWNGTGPNLDHCHQRFEHVSCDQLNTNPSFYREHRIFSELNEIHAEMNAIGFAAKKGISIADATICITYSPCMSCAKMIVASGISSVFYKHLYDRAGSDEALQFLFNNNVMHTQMRSDT